LNPDNVPVLRNCKAFEQLRVTENRDFLQVFTESNLFISVTSVKDGLIALIESNYPEVFNVVLWLLARSSTGNLRIAMSNNLTAIPNYITQELLPQIRMFALHKNTRTRELAIAILKNVGDTEFLSVFENIETWINSLALGADSPRIIDRLKRENVTLHLLVSPDITLDHILSILEKLAFKAGAIMTILESLSILRSENELSKKQAIELANALKAKEREIATDNAKNKEEKKYWDRQNN